MTYSGSATSQHNSGKTERQVKPMELIIKGEPKEIADLVEEIQSRQIEKKLNEIANKISEPVKWA